MRNVLWLLLFLLAPAWAQDLKRVKVGNQAGILKVLDAAGHTSFLKGAESWNGGGIDDRKWAPVSARERDQILQALGITRPDASARALMARYPKEKKYQREAVAVLGVLALPGENSPPLLVRPQVIQFLRNRLGSAENAFSRRQAVLALAIQPGTERATVDAMIAFLRRDHNVWNTFGTVQFFQLQRAAVLGFRDAELIKRKIKASGNPHARQILQELGETQESSNLLRTPTATPPSPPATTPMPTPSAAPASGDSR